MDKSMVKILIFKVLIRFHLSMDDFKTLFFLCPTDVNFLKELHDQTVSSIQPKYFMLFCVYKPRRPILGELLEESRKNSALIHYLNSGKP